MRFDTNDLAAFQQDFLVGIIAAEPADDSAGLAVYRGTYLHGLIDVLLSVHEKTAEMLGENTFKAFARDYVRAHPLSCGDRNFYGADFGDFLADHPQLGGLSWLPDLARFEFAIHHAHNAPDAEACDFEALLDPNGSAALHPSAQILTAAYDVRNLLATSAEPMIPRQMTCDLLIGRTPADEVVWLSLAAIEVRFLDLLRETRSLFATLDALAPTEDDMTVLQTLLARLVENGLLISLTATMETPQ